MIGVNVGSGQRKFTSTGNVTWVNIDTVSRPGEEPDLVCDGAHLPYHDGDVDYFVLSQVYEHFGCGEADGLLREAYRVLRSGGSLIISVPNMKALAKRWIAGEINEYIFMVNTYGAYRGEESDRHKWGTTPESLRCILELTCDWTWLGEFDNRSIPGLDVARDWWITCLEARK
jgi:SAM-dependent methyltransferase